MVPRYAHLAADQDTDSDRLTSLSAVEETLTARSLRN